MLSSLAVTSINHVLHNETWACERLQSISGQTVCLQISSLIHLKIMINSMGELQKLPDDADTDTTIILPSLPQPNLFDRRWSIEKSIQIVGNESLASEIIALCKQLNLDRVVAHDLSKVLGDIPTHRITSAGRGFVQWHTKNFNALSQALSEFLTEEKPVLAKTDAINQLISDIQDLQYRVEAFERRVNGLVGALDDALSENSTN